MTSLALPMIAVRSCWVATRVRIVQHKYQKVQQQKWA